MTFESVRSEGPVAPRLVLTFDCRPKLPFTHVRLTQLKSDVRFDIQLLGTASLREVVEDVLNYGTRVTLEAPISREALAYVDAHLRARQFDLMLEFRGSLQATTAAPAASGVVDTDDWAEHHVRSGQNTVRISRDDWITGVLEPLGAPSHAFLDLPLPQPPDSERWHMALEHLAHAERLYREGNDAEVLQRCYAVFDSLEGAPKNIFDSLGATDPDKREKVDKALIAFRTYLQSGRHVSTSGDSDGQFPVDHRDADFALSQTKLWLTYVARLLAASR
jgi:hypothetical protein